MDFSKKPTRILDEVRAEALKKLKKDMKLQYTYKRNGGCWLTCAHIDWPEELRFTGVSATRDQSQVIAAKHLLKTLVEKNFISHAGHLKTLLSMPECIDEGIPKSDVNENYEFNEYREVKNSAHNSSMESLNSVTYYDAVDMVEKLPPGFYEHSSFNGSPLMNNGQSNNSVKKEQFEDIISEVINNFQKLTIRSHTSPNRQLPSDDIEQFKNLRIGKNGNEETENPRRSRRSKTKRKKKKKSTISVVANKSPENKRKKKKKSSLSEVANKSPERFSSDKIVAVNQLVASKPLMGLIPEDINHFERTVRALHTSTRHFITDRIDCGVEENQNMTAESIGNKENENTESSHRLKRKRGKKKQSSASKMVNKPSEVPSSDEIVAEDLKVTIDQIMDTSILPRELKLLEEKYPFPKAVLHHLYATVVKDLKNPDYNLEQSYHKVQARHGKAVQSVLWKCTYKVKWPSEESFTATMSSKALAGKQAALKALHWLQSQGKITKTGLPLVFDPSEIKEMAKIPPEIIISPNVTEDMEILINFYTKNIEPLLNEIETDENTKASEMEKLQDGESSGDDEALILSNISDLFGNDEPSNPVTGAKLYEDNSKLISQRSKELYDRYKQRVSSASSESMWETLPISKYKNEIVKMIEDCQVVVIKGEPGCGKSTQVPQYIMEHFESQQKGANCNVIITQPRRISAISLSEWIASERKEMVGDVVGYQVRLKSVLPKPIGGGLLFCSTGILLRRLQNNPKLIGASHVILDEAHERDINTDMLLVLLRRALKLNPELRLIVMSATINAELFQDYFNGAPAIHIPGFTYPVESIFLEEIDVRKVHSSTLPCPSTDCRLVANTITWIDRTRPEGAILCFLPGWGEISTVLNFLGNLNKNSHLVLPVHSRLSNTEQRRIFTRPPRGVRKIILATNIAETSITIDDVKYVIDTGAHKEERLNIQRGVSSLDNQWVSQANVNQRKGRAGRVQPGECFHLYTRQKFNSMNPYPIPELLRVPLEKTVLDLKTYNQQDKAESLLSEMPEPPSRNAVVQAVDELIHLGALDENEKLTPLGRRIALFPLHPKLSKALVHASIFKCVSPMLTIATMLSGEAEIFLGGLNNKERVRYIKKRFHPSSDHVSLAWLYQEWEAMLQESEATASDYCYERSLNNESLKTVRKLRKLYADHLWMSRILDDLQDYSDLEAPSNIYAGNDEFVKGVLFSGTGTLLYRRNWDFKDGRYLTDVNVVFTESGRRTTISSESVNFKRTEFPSPFLTYFRHLESMERRTVMIRESSILSPLSVFLFSEGTITVHKYSPPPYCGEGQWKEHVLVKINRRNRDIVLLCQRNLVLQLAEFKVVLWNMVNYFILKSGVEDDDERYKTISSFHNRLLKTMGNVLFQSGAMIEYDKDGNKID